MTLIFCGAEKAQVRNVKATILYFEAVSRLKVNFFKSELIGIRTKKLMLLNFADILGCKVGQLPALYLGMPLCLGRVTKSLWNPVIKRVERNLSIWKANYLLQQI